MADEIRNFVVLANNLVDPSIFQTHPLTVPPAVVERIEVRIPAGHTGLTGIALAIGQQRVIPTQIQSSGFHAGDWITDDDRIQEFITEGYPTTGQWEAHTYNLDLFDHKFYLTFHLDRAAMLENQNEEFEPLRIV